MSLETPRVFYTSWLWKQPEWRPIWDKRFFILNGLRLAYRLEENGIEKKSGFIISLQRDVNSPQSRIFRVWLKEGDCWTLRAESEEEYQTWIHNITNILIQDTARENNNNNKEIRTGIVLKKSAWTGQWRERYVELYESQLLYRLSKKDPVRKEYIIVAIDISSEKEISNELFITTSCNERFWLKFLTKEEFNDWYNVIIRSLKRTISWHCMFLQPTNSSNYNTLRVQYHATTKGNNNIIYCYGGIKSLATQFYCQKSKLFLPLVNRDGAERQISKIQLSGEHLCTLLDILPFEESFHAKLRPPTLFGSALCSLKFSLLLSSSSSSNNNNNKIENFKECLILFGGRSEILSVRDNFVDLWWCLLQESLTKWNYYRYDASILPHRTFHTLNSRNSTEAILIGGIDNINNRICADCFIISWPKDEISKDISFIMKPPEVKFLGFLPEPRAFHACVTLQDNSLLIIGGHTIYYNNNNNNNNSKRKYYLEEKIKSEGVGSILRLFNGETEWKELEVNPPLPNMYQVCATEFNNNLNEESVFVLGEICNINPIVKLFHITINDTINISREIPLTIGAIPRYFSGAKMYYAGEYIYIIGGCYNSNNRLKHETGEQILFQDPIRILIGNS